MLKRFFYLFMAFSVNSGLYKERSVATSKKCRKLVCEQWKKFNQWHRRTLGRGARKGGHYEYGLGTKNSFKEAGKWYTFAASQGNEDAKVGIERVVKKASSRIYCFFFGADLPEVTVLPVVL